MSEWKEYTGSDEQIAEIKSSGHCVIFRYPLMGQIVESKIIHAEEIDGFLFCNKCATEYRFTQLEGEA